MGDGSGIGWISLDEGKRAKEVRVENNKEEKSSRRFTE